MTTIHELTRDIRVRSEVDVLVVGGGSAGVIAALAIALYSSGVIISSPACEGGQCDPNQSR